MPGTKMLPFRSALAVIALRPRHGVGTPPQETDPDQAHVERLVLVVVPWRYPIVSAIARAFAESNIAAPSIAAFLGASAEEAEVVISTHEALAEDGRKRVERRNPQRV